MGKRGHLAFAKTNDALIRNSTLTEAIDSNGYSTDSLVQWLGYRAAEHRHLQVVEERLAEGDIAEIDEAISHLDSLLTGDPIAIDEARHYKEIARMHRDYLDLGQTWSDLDNADIGRLEEIANQYHGLATVKARKVLEIYHGYTFSTEPERPQYDAIEFSDSG